LFEFEDENALLIAAAPDMLDTLQDILYIMNNSRGITGWHLNGNIAEWEEFEFFDKIHAVINKALGE
jgi:hypothetical protein